MNNFFDVSDKIFKNEIKKKYFTERDQSLCSVKLFAYSAYWDNKYPNGIY